MILTDGCNSTQIREQYAQIYHKQRAAMWRKPERQQQALVLRSAATPQLPTFKLTFRAQNLHLLWKHAQQKG
jgi:hypothetical protein